MITGLFTDGQSVELSLPCDATLAVRYLGNEDDVLVPNGSCGVVVSVLEYNLNTLATVKFDGLKRDLVIPTKYLKAC
jgi:hypothetical protein